MTALTAPEFTNEEAAIAHVEASRWPDGVTGHTFWQKQIPHWAPQWITRWDYPEAGSSESHTYLVADGVVERYA